MSYRIDQINSLIKKELPIILLEVLGKTQNIITITEIDTSRDLSYSKVWVSIIGDIDATFDMINTNIYDIQKNIFKRLSIKKTPKLIFKLDDSYERVSRITKLME